jgi:hypothetical protein
MLEVNDQFSSALLCAERDAALMEPVMIMEKIVPNILLPQNLTRFRVQTASVFR